ncbi:hypothetical protein MD484_g5040, partial [Candolleomyces efflorescens]
MSSYGIVFGVDGRLLPLFDNLGYLALGYVLTSLIHRYYTGSKTKSGRLPLPPSLPFAEHLGNVLKNRFPYLLYHDWAKECGTDIISAQAENRTIIALNSLEAVTTVLEHRATIYSDRVQDVMKCDVMGWGWVMSSLPYGDRWRKERSLFQHHLQPSSAKVHGPRCIRFVRGMLLPRLLEGPKEVIPVIRQFLGGLTLSISYGIPIQSKNDPYVRLAEKAIAGIRLAETEEETYLVDRYPVLKYVPGWVPGASWKRNAMKWRSWEVDMREKPFDMALKSIRSGKFKPSFTSEAVTALDLEANVEDVNAIRNVAAMIYAAGADTLASSISTFFLAMLVRPDVQTKAQEELDRVLGPNRLPTLEDRHNLPYITAIVREVMRAILHNEDDFPDPDSFKPERFLHPDGRLNRTIMDPARVAFGFGRRACAGKDLALSTMWITVASVLAAFKIENGVSDTGKALDARVEYLPGTVRHPVPFRVTMTVRSEEVARIIRDAEERDVL